MRSRQTFLTEKPKNENNSVREQKIILLKNSFNYYIDYNCGEIAD
jgi:hypothetical protein